MSNTPITKLDQLIRARYPLIGIISHEETRVLAAITEVAKNMKLTSGSRVPRRVAEWALTTGLTGVSVTADEYSDPNAALEWISKFDEKGEETPTIFVMKDLHKIMAQDLKVTRYLRDIATRFEIRKHNLILLSPEMSIPTDLEKQMAILDWPLPDTDELTAILSQAEADLPSGLQVTLNGSRDLVTQAMCGLTAFEAAGVLNAGIVATGELGNGVMSHILSEKKQIIRKSGILEYFEATVTMSDVGGLDKLKEYAAMKRTAMSAEARAAGVDSPKGVLLVGPAGTGKSLSAKAIAGGKMPLLRFDVGKVLGGGRVGEAEGNISQALKIAEAVAPCVLWLDEIEKALSDNNGASDGGVMMRVLGSLLTWMQETSAPVYVVATANNISALRPELLSRFDDVVFVPLPDADSRNEILKVHLAKRGKKVDNLKPVIDATWGFSGREIEKCVKFAVERAFFEKRKLTVTHLLEAAQGIVSTYETKREEINTLIEWSKGRAVMAGRPLETKPVTTRQNKTVEV
jgi:AAA+ superfamily predicted ATPase